MECWDCRWSYCVHSSGIADSPTVSIEHWDYRPSYHVQPFMGSGDLNTGLYTCRKALLGAIFISENEGIKNKGKLVQREPVTVSPTSTRSLHQDWVECQLDRLALVSHDQPRNGFMVRSWFIREMDRSMWVPTLRWKEWPLTEQTPN